jgi:glycosyltransferase involved in cell wall biosynthesis
LATVVGRLVPGKRVDLAIEAVTKLRGLVHLRVIGDGPESAHLAAMAPSSVVSFSGRIPRQEALAWISASDVLIHPSRDEAAPCVVREARLLNTPVVACDCGDLSDWAKSDGGITIVAPIANQLANALCSSLGIQG